MSRIDPLPEPWPADVADQLASMMPPGVPPIGLFRTFVRNLPMARAMPGWGSYALSRELSLSLRQRELVIDRVTARCGCEYEWGVHVAFFAERAGLTPEQVTSLTHGGPADPCWSDDDAVVLQAVDALHDQADIDDTRSPTRRTPPGSRSNRARRGSPTSERGEDTRLPGHER